MTGGARSVRQITSAANPLLKAFRRALADGSTRQGWLAVEGPHPVEEAIDAGATLHCVLVARPVAAKFRPLLARLDEGAEVVEVPGKLFNGISATEAPQGLAALIELKSPALDGLLHAPDALLVVACGVQEPGNMGTMIRSAQALGGTGLLALKGTVSAFNPKAVRASAGAIFRLPVVQSLEPALLFDRMRRAGVRIIAADGRSPMRLGDADLSGRLAFLIGREGKGLAEEVSREAAQLLAIPLRPGTDSVNAAMAAGIFLYEAARQRGFRY